MKNNLENSDTKERILKTATKLFAQRGFDGTSVRDICKASGVNVALVSYYWGGKKELFEAVVEDLLNIQTKYAQSVLDFAISPEDLSEKEQVEMMYIAVDKAIDFFYNDASYELLTNIMRGQKELSIIGQVPFAKYAARLLSAILKKKETDKEVILTLGSIIAQIYSPRLLPFFTINLMGQRTFHPNDIKIIRRNVHIYIDALLRERGIVFTDLKIPKRYKKSTLLK